MATKTVSDSTLNTYWRKAVYQKYAGRCARCGGFDIQAHHVVYRRKKVLAWDYRNGIALCTECHAWAHTTAGRLWVESQVDMDYLAEMDVTLADYRTERGITRDEFRMEKLNELKEYLDG